MSWLAIVLFIIQHLPDFITIIVDIINALGGKGHQALHDARVNLSSAIQTGDLSNAKQAITNQAVSLGVAVPAHLVGE